MSHSFSLWEKGFCLISSLFHIRWWPFRLIEESDPFSKEGNIMTNIKTRREWTQSDSWEKREEDKNVWTKNDNNVISSQAEGNRTYRTDTGEEQRYKVREERSGEGHFISCLSPMLTFIHSLSFPLQNRSWNEGSHADDQNGRKTKSKAKNIKNKRTGKKETYRTCGRRWELQGKCYLNKDERERKMSSEYTITTIRIQSRDKK